MRPKPFIMEKNDMLEIVVNLTKDEHITVYESDGTLITLFRPSKLPKRMTGYDVERNFQIFLHHGERSFRPNHLRGFIDLGLRSKCRPDLKRELCKAFDLIYLGEDPFEVISDISKQEFPLELNRIDIIAQLVQLFIIEQEYNYLRESHFDPPVLFFQGWIRTFLDSPKEIDNLCMSVARFQPPPVRYTSMENGKHRKFQEERPELWYLD